MGQHTVWSCDLCGKDVPEDDVRAFYGPVSHERVDVGECCRQRPISVLTDAFARLATTSGNGKQ